MKKVLIALALMMSLAYLKGNVSGADKPHEPAPTPEFLPAMFRPLSWGMNIKELKSLFPSAELQETTYTAPNDEMMTVSMVFGITWDYLGEAYVHVAHHNYGRIDIIRISTTETRPECFEDPPWPDWCRSVYSDDLVKILGELKGVISKAYGPPLEYEGGYREAAGLPPDPRERGYKWEREGYNLFLNITVGEEDDWAVDLTAVRREGLPGVGHAVFYSFDKTRNNNEAASSEEDEADYDLRYYYEQLKSWLGKKGIAHSFQGSPGFTIKAASGKELLFSKDLFESDVGVVLIRNDGAYRLISGVTTDVDLMADIISFFGIER
ncbi:MAG: hypothetical protein V3W31_09715 [Thermodesulfobacteriota bacterium]